MADDVPETVDEGWQGVRSFGARLVLPSFTMRRARDLTDRLLGVRAVWSSTVAIHAVIGVIALLSIGTASTTGSWSLGLGLALVAVVGIGVSIARWRLATRPYDCDDPAELADSYYIGFLKETALVSLVLPWGIIAGLFTGSVAVTGLAAAIAAADLTWMAPTRSAVAALAQRVRADGCDVDLLAVLQTGGAEGGRGRSGRSGRRRPAAGTGADATDGGDESDGADGGSGGRGGDNRSKKKRKRR